MYSTTWASALHPEGRRQAHGEDLAAAQRQQGRVARRSHHGRGQAARDQQAMNRRRIFACVLLRCWPCSLPARARWPIRAPRSSANFPTGAATGSRHRTTWISPAIHRGHRRLQPATDRLRAGRAVEGRSPGRSAGRDGAAVPPRRWPAQGHGLGLPDDDGTGAAHAVPGHAGRDADHQQLPRHAACVHRWPAASSGGRSLAHALGRFHRPLGRRHAGDRHRVGAAAQCHPHQQHPAGRGQPAALRHAAAGPTRRITSNGCARPAPTAWSWR